MEWVGQAEGEGSGGLQAGDIGSMLSTPWGGGFLQSHENSEVPVTQPSESL